MLVQSVLRSVGGEDHATHAFFIPQQQYANQDEKVGYPNRHDGRERGEEEDATTSVDEILDKKA